VAGKRHPRNAKWKMKRNKLFKAQKGKCHWCGIDMKQNISGQIIVPRDAVTLDHILPLAEGGSKRIKNLVAACSRCNNQRGHEYNTTKQPGGE